jgi:hypothetical protein
LRIFLKGKSSTFGNSAAVKPSKLIKKRNKNPIRVIYFIFFIVSFNYRGLATPSLQPPGNIVERTCPFPEKATGVLRYPLQYFEEEWRIIAHFFRFVFPRRDMGMLF